MTAITPVSALHEYCAKKKFSIPIYEYIDETNDSVKSYVCKVTALNTSITGIGRSKQEAKHEATYLLIKEVAVDHPDINNIAVHYKQVPITDTVLQLRNLCLQNEYPLPTFSVKQVTGPSHSPQFSVGVQSMSITRYGTGSSIIQARQLASQNVINVLHTVDRQSFDNMEVKTFEKSCSDHQNILRETFQSYRDLVDDDIPLVSDGTPLSHRHNYFTKYKDDVKEKAKIILNSNQYHSDEEQLKDFLDALGIQTRLTLSSGEDYNKNILKIELLIKAFDVLFMNSKDEIYTEMLEYFRDMI